MNKADKIEFGDFQTPLLLAQQVCQLLDSLGIGGDCVLEPTCGQGAFLLAAAATFAGARLFGWDINEGYVEAAKSALAEAGARSRSSLVRHDFFTHDWTVELSSAPGRLLVLGNLPWVTNAAVSGVNGSNLPVKENFLGLRGLAARTGKSNFDISEWMLMSLLKALRGRTATLAMLCKTATARKFLRFAWENDGRVEEASLYRIDAKKHFGAAVDACLLVARIGSNGPPEATVYEDLASNSRSHSMGLAGKDLVRDLYAYRKLKHLEGLCPYQWRSGLKHDCASVMELFGTEEISLTNKIGEAVVVEPDFLFPLLKCSDLANGRFKPERFVLVPQRTVGEDTTLIAARAPQTWNYLESHRERFESRKSSIYKGRGPFSIFGVGAYSFSPWKVAISALHRSPKFLVVGPAGKKPVFFDDTCYFLSFDNEGEARIVAKILNSKTCLQFLDALTFTDSKRPITVELLQRLNLSALATDEGLADAWANVRNHNARDGELSGSSQAEFMMERFNANDER